MSHSPQRIEEILAERAERLANRLSARSGPVRTREILLIKIGGDLAGIDVAFTEEILRVENLVPVPDAAAHLLGILNVQNDFVCLLDGASFLNPSQTPEAYPWAVRLRHATLRVAVACDEVIRLEKLPIEVFDEQGIFRHGDTLGTLLNISALLTPLEQSTNPS